MAPLSCWIVLVRQTAASNCFISARIKANRTGYTALNYCRLNIIECDQARVILVHRFQQRCCYLKVIDYLGKLLLHNFQIKDNTLKTNLITTLPSVISLSFNDNTQTKLVKANMAILHNILITKLIRHGSSPCWHTLICYEMVGT